MPGVTPGRIGQLAAATWIIALPVFSCGTARADTDADRTRAAELFKDGRALMTAGLYAQACDELEESQRLDPGGGTLLNVALCHERQGRIATALSEFDAALALARRDGRADRVAAAQRHIEDLGPRVPHLAVVVPPDARVSGLVVLRDGVAVDATSWERATPVDKGEHVVEARAPGRADWRTSVHLDEDAASAAVEVPVLEPLVKTPPPKPPDTPVPNHAQHSETSSLTAAPHSKSHDRTPVASSTWQRPTAVAMGAFGGATLVVGGALGIIAANQWSDARRQGCSDEACRGASAWASWSDARQNASAATVAVALGASEVAVALVVWLMAPAPGYSLRVEAQPVGLRVTASF